MSATLTPHLTVNDAAAAIAFYTQAFGAVEHFRLPTPDGKIMHAEIQIGDMLLFLNDEFPEMGSKPPSALNSSPVTLHLQVDDVDTWMQQAIAAGATVTMPVEKMFWGDRYGRIVDPFGHEWSLATQVETVSPEDVKQRAAALFAA